VTGNIVNEKKDKNCSMCLALLPLIIIKPGVGLIWTRGRVPGFMNQPGSTRVNLKKLKNIKVLIFYMKKSM